MEKKRKASELSNHGISDDIKDVLSSLSLPQLKELQKLIGQKVREHPLAVSPFPQFLNGVDVLLFALAGSSEADDPDYCSFEFHRISANEFKKFRLVLTRGELRDELEIITCYQTGVMWAGTTPYECQGIAIGPFHEVRSYPESDPREPRKLPKSNSGFKDIHAIMTKYGATTKEATASFLDWVNQNAWLRNSNLTFGLEEIEEDYDIF